MQKITGSILGEFQRYKTLGEKSIAQLSDEELCQSGPSGTNSIATLVWHLSGNFASRFTDFLTSDGEKPWRNRDSEFEPRTVSREELLEKWEAGWGILLETLKALQDEDLQKLVTIRGQPLSVSEALHRSLAHCAYHVGQITMLARMMRGEKWNYLSIPPGGSAEYNKNPTRERGDGDKGKS
ncbi:MAG TPA: DinB family protein [Planctomycetota bacterium]|nr:DinB family protein [Planctomycetota bacterium]